MKPTPFELVRPATTEEAIACLQGMDGMAKVMAGGQSLVPMLNLRLAPLERLVDLSRVAGLDTVDERENALAFGALVTHAAIEDGAMRDPSNGFMRRVAASIAYRAIRNRGTIGGSLALSDPSAEWVSLMTTLDAAIEVQGAQGVRSIPARDFMLSAYTTMMDEEELLTAVVVPDFSPRTRCGYYKMCRKTGEYATSLAMAVRDPARRYCRVVVGATGGKPIILEKTAALLEDAAGWSPETAAVLGEAILDELSAGPRAFDDFETDIHAAGVLAAAREVLAS